MTATPPVSAAPPPAAGGPVLVPLSFDQQVFVDAYKDAIKQAVASASDASGALLTACFSIATAYGALIGLVAPKDQQNRALVLAPFVFLAGAVLAAMIGKVSGIAVGSLTTPGQVSSAIGETVRTKKRASWAAIALVSVSMIVAGVVIVKSYAGTRKPASETVVVRLSDAGQKAYQAACGKAASSVTGTIRSSAAGTTFVEVTLDKVDPCGGLSKLVLPTADVVTAAVAR
jgi:hypothetical protein